MNCPICGLADAEDITARPFDGKSIRCDYCGDYDISGSVYEPNTLAGMDLERRIAALHRAKQSKGEKIRLMIMTYDL